MWKHDSNGNVIDKSNFFKFFSNLGHDPTKKDIDDALLKFLGPKGFTSVEKQKILGASKAITPIFGVQCFPANTLIQTSLTSTTPISALSIGDTILAFDPTADLGRGALVPRRVTRLFRNSTMDWIKLTWVDPTSGAAQELVATPGHNMLDKHGHFTCLDALVAGNTCEIILSSGDCIMAQAERLVYSAATAEIGRAHV